MEYATQTPGFSESAEFVTQQGSLCSRHMHESSAFGIESLLREELVDIWLECRKPDWDGYEAIAVSWESWDCARKLLQSLPLGFPHPSIGAEPDGQVTLEWHRSPYRTLSVSVSPDGELHYAALLGHARRACGTEPFLGRIPTAVSNLIRRVYLEC